MTDCEVFDASGKVSNCCYSFVETLTDAKWAAWARPCTLLPWEPRKILCCAGWLGCCWGIELVAPLWLLMAELMANVPLTSRRV